MVDDGVWTPDISEWTIIRTGFVQGIGISCISVPLATVAFATLPLELRAEATGIFSLVRNLGSSIGIPVTGALLETNTEVNHAVSAATITPFNRTLQTGTISRFWNPTFLQGASLLNDEITRQAKIIAYIDDFKLMLILAIIVLPLVVLIRPAAQIKIDAKQLLATPEAGVSESNMSK